MSTIQELTRLLRLPKTGAAVLGYSSKSSFVTRFIPRAPMMATFSVALAKICTFAALRQCCRTFPYSLRFLLDSYISNQRGFLPYIDYITSICTLVSRFDKTGDLTGASIAYVHLAINHTKHFSADKNPYHISPDVSCWRDETNTVKPSYALRLLRHVNPVVPRKGGSSAKIRQIVGL